MPRLKKRPSPPRGLVRHWQTTLSENSSTSKQTASLWSQSLDKRTKKRCRHRYNAFACACWDSISHWSPLTRYSEPLWPGRTISAVLKRRSIVQHVSASLSASNTQFERIREKQEDEVCQTLRQYCNEGWPDSTRVPDALKPYWQTKDDLSVVHGLLLKAERIVIPTTISLEMLDRVQEGYQGVTKCRERAKRALWWPGLSRQIEGLVKQCRKLLNEEFTKKELMIPSVVPDSSSRSVTCHPSPRLKR